MLKEKEQKRTEKKRKERTREGRKGKSYRAIPHDGELVIDYID